jgi:hypothetical protein
MQLSTWGRKRLITYPLALTLAGVFWILGDVEKPVASIPSPDRRFRVVLTSEFGWRTTPISNKFRVYLTDARTGQRHLAGTQPQYCYFNEVRPKRVEWNHDGRGVSIHWEIEDLGPQVQHFRLSQKPPRLVAQSS